MLPAAPLHDAMCSVRIEVQSDFSSHEEHRHENYQYFAFLPEYEKRDSVITKEIARLSAACNVHSCVQLYIQFVLSSASTRNFAPAVTSK